MKEFEHKKIETNKITVGSMFAGIGGICLGFKQAGFDIIWANEKDSAACRTYRHNLGGSYLVEADIKKLDKYKIPKFDILTAGFPCQPFSVGGAQRGFNDNRGNLFFQIMEVVKIVNPKVIFLENVSNLIDHDNGKTFITIFNALSELDYIVRYRNLPANEYGNTPQTRNRVYIAAFRNFLWSEKFQFPEKIPLTKTIVDIINFNEKKKEIYYYKKDDLYFEYVRSRVKKKNSIYRIYNSKIYLAKNQTCPTLTASMGIRPNSVPIIMDEYGYRRLTVQECLDFQGFPANFSFPVGTTIQEAYKQIGNSVCVPIIFRIAEELYKVMKENVPEDV